MADADVPITAGTGTKIDTRTVGAGTDEHRQVFVQGSPTTAAAVAEVDATLLASRVAGATYATVSGTITTATSTVTTGNIGLAGNITVFMYGTYAGVNATFEISPDNTNWFPVAATREDTATSETSTGVLPSNTARAWTLGAPGFAFFRVRATAWTSGTANVAIVAGTYPFEPMVSNVARKDSNRNLVKLFNTGGSTTATEALVSLTGWKSGAAVAATTTPAVVTAGKTLRIQTIVLGYGSVATAGSARIALRYNASGVVAVTSPIVDLYQIGNGAPTVAGAWGYEVIDMPDGMEISAGVGIGFSVLGLSTTLTAAAVGFYSVALTGYEY